MVLAVVVITTMVCSTATAIAATIATTDKRTTSVPVPCCHTGYQVRRVAIATIARATIARIAAIVCTIVCVYVITVVI